MIESSLSIREDGSAAFLASKLPYSQIEIPDGILEDPTKTILSSLTDHTVGSFASFCSYSSVQDILQERYGRSGLALKLLPLRGAETPGLADWRGVSLGQASLVQNLVALEGLAPRVYGLALVNGEYAAQVVECVGGGGGPRNPRIGDALVVLQRLGVSLSHPTQGFGIGENNWMGGLLIDFCGMFLSNDVVDRLVVEIRRRAMVKKGQRASSAYQEVRELGIPGDRPADREIPSQVAALINGATVLDLGCNLGHLSRLADRSGALRVIGVDQEGTAKLCRLVHLLLGHWNIDVISATLPTELPSVPYDVVFCLSTVKYIGDLLAIPWLASLAQRLWLEGDGSPASHYWEALNTSYSHVERLADTTDNHRRAQFLCTNLGTHTRAEMPVRAGR